MNCPTCGAAMRLDDDKDFLMCGECRKPFVPETSDEGVRLLGEPAGRSCPVCNVPLTKASIAGCRIEACEKCRGILIPMGAFLEVMRNLGHGGTLTAELEHKPERRDLERRISCPQCRGRMDTHFYAGPGNIVIDDCSRCCLNWLDHGELARVVHAAGISVRSLLFD